MTRKPPKKIHNLPALSKWGHFRRSWMLTLRILLGSWFIVAILLAVATYPRYSADDTLTSPWFIALTAPSFIQEAETAWNTGTTPKTTASFSVQTGDVLVALTITEGYNFGGTNKTVNVAGGSLTWTLAQAVTVADFTYAAAYTTTATSDASITVSFTLSTTFGGSPWFGGNVLTFRGSDGVGASSKTNANDGAPSLALVTTADNSAIVCANGDYEAGDGASRTWRTISVSATEVTYFRDASHYTAYGAYWSDVGTAGSKTTGLTAPNSQDYSIVAVEVKGTAGGGAAGHPAARRYSGMGVGNPFAPKGVEGVRICKGRAA